MDDIQTSHAEAKVDCEHSQKTALPPKREKRKAVLPPVKQGILNQTEGDSARYIDEFTPLNTGKRIKIRCPMMTSTLAMSLGAKIIVLSLLHIYLICKLSGEAVFEADVFSYVQEYETFTKHLELFILVLSVLFGVSFLSWVRRAVLNADLLSRDQLGIPVSNMIVTFFVPVYHLWGVYSKMRKLLNASIDPDCVPFQRHRLHIALWWLGVVWIITWSLVRTMPSVQTIDELQKMLSQALYFEVGLIVAVLLSISVVYRISKAQLND